MPAIRKSELGLSVRNQTHSLQLRALAIGSGRGFFSDGPPSTNRARYGPAWSTTCPAKQEGNNAAKERQSVALLNADERRTLNVHAFTWLIARRVISRCSNLVFPQDETQPMSLSELKATFGTIGNPVWAVFIPT